jgi:hypothetical protein
MSNYLTRLLERSRGSAPQIEPLIAPFHTPSNDLFGEPTELQSQAGVAPVGNAGSAADHAAPNDVRRETTVAPERTIPVSPEIRITESKRSGPSPAPPEFRREEPAESGQQKETRSPARFRPETNVPSISSLKERLAGGRAPVGEAEPGTGAQANQPLSPLPDRARIVVQPQVATRRPSPDSSRAAVAAASANEPPAIHVTIGRVEVRAITAPAPPRSPAPPAAPKISLDDYLKRRNGARS